MESTPPVEALDSSFDLVTRQDATEAAVEALRGDVEDVKSRLDRVGRAAARPLMEGAATAASVEVKGFVDGYLRMGRETELKSMSGLVAADGGYAVPREIDALIARRLKNVSPIRSIAQVVQTGSAGYRKLVNTGGTASGWVSEATRAVGDDEFSAATGISRRRAPRPAQPVSSLRYYDVSRDYLPGVQHATGRATPGQPRTLELPAALEASGARALVETVSGRLDWSRDTVTWRTAELDGEIAPGACVSFDQMPGRWRVREWEWRDTGVEITAERMPPTASGWSLALPTDPGQAHRPEDLPSAPTLIAAFELPYDPAIGSPGTARPLAAVSSGQANWNGAALYADRGDGSLLPLGPSGRTRCVMGRVTNLVPAASPLLFDRGSQIIVELADDGMQLASATARQLAEGANVALVGEELIQFAQATLLSGGTWRLTGLLRGRGATENGIATHAAAETFVLVDSRLTSLDPAKLGSNSARRIVAIGLGDPQGVGTGVALSGLTLCPPAPVHARTRILADGTRRLEWTRRARGLHDWRDGVDVPLIEETESYIVRYGPPGSPLAQWTTGQASLDIPPQVHAALAAQAPDQRFHVVQKGTFALSDRLDLGPIA